MRQARKGSERNGRSCKASDRGRSHRKEKGRGKPAKTKVFWLEQGDRPMWLTATWATVCILYKAATSLHHLRQPRSSKLLLSAKEGKRVSHGAEDDGGEGELPPTAREEAQEGKGQKEIYGREARRERRRR